MRETKHKKAKIEQQNQIQLPKALHEKIQALNGELFSYKIAIADRFLEMQNISIGFTAKQAEIQATIQGYAKQFDIDLSDPKKGRWNFDVTTGILRRIEE